MWDVIRVAEKKIAPSVAVDYTEQELMLRSSSTINELQENFKRLTKEQANALVNVKDQMKTKLTPAHNESLNL